MSRIRIKINLRCSSMFKTMISCRQRDSLVSLRSPLSMTTGITPISNNGSDPKTRIMLALLSTKVCSEWDQILTLEPLRQFRKSSIDLRSSNRRMDRSTHTWQGSLIKKVILSPWNNCRTKHKRPMVTWVLTWDPHLWYKIIPRKA